MNGEFCYVARVDLLACRIVHVDLTCGDVDVTARVNRDALAPAICEYLHIVQSTVGTDRAAPRCLSRLVGDIRRLSDRDGSRPETTQLTAAFYAVAHRSVHKILPCRQERPLVRRHQVTRRLRHIALVYLPIAHR